MNVGQFEDETHANLKFLAKKIPKEIQKGHCVRIPHAISA